MKKLPKSILPYWPLLCICFAAVFYGGCRRGAAERTQTPPRSSRFKDLQLLYLSDAWNLLGVKRVEQVLQVFLQIL